MCNEQKCVAGLGLGLGNETYFVLLRAVFLVRCPSLLLSLQQYITQWATCGLTVAIIHLFPSPPLPLPPPPPPQRDTVSDQKLDGGKVWERGESNGQSTLARLQH